MIRVAILEDEKNYNFVLKKIIDFEDNMTCCGQFFNGGDAIDGLESIKPHVVITDIRLPDMLGYKVVAILKPTMEKTHFLMCTSFEQEEHIFNALKAGASGYLVKGESMQKIVESINDVYLGGAPMSNVIAQQVLNYFRQQSVTNKELEDLTPTQFDVLNLLTEGFLYKEIADKRNVTIDTIKKHVGLIYKKLHVANKAEAIKKFNESKNK